MQNAQISNIVEFLNDDQNMMELFKRFLIGFFREQYQNEIDAIGLEIEFIEDDLDEANCLRFELDSIFDTVYDSLSNNLCSEAGVNYLYNNGFSYEFHKWFDHTFINARDDEEFKRELQSNVVGMFHDDFTNDVDNDDNFIDIIEYLYDEINNRMSE